MTIKKIRRKLQKLLFREQWSLLVSDHDGKLLKHIEPPSDRIWADPFPVEYEGRYLIFIEQQFAGQNGTLGYIELFEDYSLSEFRPILEKPYHLSWPNVFNHRGTWYMIPETNEHGCIDLYRAADFPDKWEFDRTLLHTVHAVDTMLLEEGGMFWLFTSMAECSAAESSAAEHSASQVAPGYNNSLSIFYADEFPAGEWKPHAANPVVIDASRSRMAGRFQRTENGSLLRPAQNCRIEYGRSIRVNRIVELSKDAYREASDFEILPERHLHAACTHTLNLCGKYAIRDIKTRKFRLW